PLGPDGRRRTSGGVSIPRGSPRGGDLSVELASRRHRDDPTRARSRGLPMNLSSVIVLLGVAADGWLLAFLAIRGRRPWLQSTFAACALSFLVVGAWSAARNEGVLPAVREDLVLGLMLLTHALTAILVLGLIHGEALPRRRAMTFLLLVPIPLLAYLAPIEGWTVATAYEGTVLGGFRVLCLGIALGETLFSRDASPIFVSHAFWFSLRFLHSRSTCRLADRDHCVRVPRVRPRRFRRTRRSRGSVRPLRLAGRRRGRGASAPCGPRLWIDRDPVPFASHGVGAEDPARTGPTGGAHGGCRVFRRSEEHTSELQSRGHLVCRLLLEKRKP